MIPNNHALTLQLYLSKRVIGIEFRAYNSRPVHTTRQFALSLTSPHLDRIKETRPGIEHEIVSVRGH